MFYLLSTDAWVHICTTLKIKSIALINSILKIKLHACNLSIDQNNIILYINITSLFIVDIL